MIKYFLLPWGLFFAVLAFSMMPGYMTFVVIVSVIGGVLDARQKIKKQNKNRRLNMTLDADAWNF